jgi:uncharacterized coiled-coil DUF342 family protein
MDNQEKEIKLEQIRQKIITLQAEALSLKTQADKLIQEAQTLSAKRIEVLEQTQSLAIEFTNLKNPKQTT